jgi:hypothetical protein
VPVRDPKGLLQGDITKVSQGFNPVIPCLVKRGGTLAVIQGSVGLAPTKNCRDLLMALITCSTLSYRSSARGAGLRQIFPTLALPCALEVVGYHPIVV